MWLIAVLYKFDFFFYFILHVLILERMIFLKKYKRFALDYYTNEYGKVIWINDLSISFLKYLSKNNSHVVSMSSGLLKYIIICAVDKKNINGRTIISDKKIEIYYNGGVSYDIKIHDFVDQEMIHVHFDKTIHTPYRNFDYKILCQKLIYNNDISNFTRNFISLKWCVII